MRTCSHCGRKMTQGYCIDGGCYYYCSTKCMNADGISNKQFEKLYDDGEGDSYYTEWDEDDIEEE